MRNQALSGNALGARADGGDGYSTPPGRSWRSMATRGSRWQKSSGSRARTEPSSPTTSAARSGLLAALVDSLFQDPDGDPVEKIRDSFEGSDRTRRFLQWQEKVSANDRVNRVLHEMLPVAMRDPMVRNQFADAYRLYRTIDAECLSSAPAQAQRQPGGLARGRWR